MHMKRYSMPAFWPLGRKQEKFVVTPTPGPHPKGASIALRVVLRDVLGYAETASEASKVVKGGGVMVDKRVIKDDKYPVGLMDVVEFPSVKKYYRVVAGPKGLLLSETDASHSSKKLCSIRGKRAVKGGKIQLQMHDGRTLITDKAGKYKPGDSVLIELPGQKVLEHFPLKEGVHAVVFAGKTSGASGRIKSIKTAKSMTERGRVVVETKEGDIETLKEYVIVGEAK